MPKNATPKNPVAQETKPQGHVLSLGLIAVGVGVVLCALMPIVGGIGLDLWGSLRLIAFMFAATAISAVVGFIFGVPRRRVENPSATPSTGERSSGLVFEANSNLEQISDWLTKLLVGAGLVQLAALPAFLRSLGDYLGPALGFAGGPQSAVAIVLYGVGVGFLVSYLWARLRFRVLLEESEVLANYQWAARRTLLETQLVAAEQQKAEATTTTARSRSQVARTIDGIAPVLRDAQNSSPVLWIDDHPERNVAIVNALEAAGIEVELSTGAANALERARSEKYGLIVTDILPEVPKSTAKTGLELIQTLVTDARGRPPIIAYGAESVLKRTAELKSAGVRYVTGSPSELFGLALESLAS